MYGKPKAEIALLRLEGDTMPDDHGNHVAGIAAGRYTGVAPDANIISIINSQAPDTSYSEYNNFKKIVNYLLDQKRKGKNIRILNISQDVLIPKRMKKLFLALVSDLEKNGIIIVKSASYKGRAYVSNNRDIKKGEDVDTFTNIIASFSLTVSLANTQGTAKISDDSVSEYVKDIGTGLLIYGPGEHILSSLKEGYGYMSGTSMATPFVSGVIALMLQIKPHLTPRDIKDILKDTSDKLPTKSGNALYVNPKKALEKAGL